MAPRPRAGPIHTLDDLEDITSAWVGLYNDRRLMHRLGRRPPAEAEAEYSLDSTPESTPVTRNEVCMKPGMLHYRGGRYPLPGSPSCGELAGETRAGPTPA